RADLRLATILRERGIPGSFYIPILPFESRPELTHRDLRSLSSEGFEIGAHGFSHVPLSRLTKELSKEVADCKPILEDILGKEVQMFCYPQGRFDANVLHVVK